MLERQNYRYVHSQLGAAQCNSLVELASERLHWSSWEFSALHKDTSMVVTEGGKRAPSFSHLVWTLEPAAFQAYAFISILRLLGTTVFNSGFLEN